MTARFHIENSINVRPDNAAARLLAGRIARAAGDFDAALAHFDRAIALAPQRDAFVEKARTLVSRLLEGGPDYLGDYDRGMGFWMEIWDAMKLEERLVPFEEVIDTALPPGLDVAKLEEILKDAPSDLRFHLSSGALESFYHTIPLLYPRGYLQVQDIFVTDLNQYRLGFHGPGKLDGSIVNWVNGVLLREVGERSGYDVHFAPFQYRKGSKTSILYTTLRE